MKMTCLIGHCVGNASALAGAGKDAVTRGPAQSMDTGDGCEDPSPFDRVHATVATAATMHATNTRARGRKGTATVGQANSG